MPRFSASMDNTAKGITIMVCVVIIFPFITIFEIFAKNHNWLVLITPIVVIGILFCCFLWRSRGYSLESGELQIHRQIGDIVIPLNNIESIVPVNLKDYGFGLRTFGSGGFFGYIGWFWYKELGHIRVYATDRSKMLLVTLREAEPSKKHIAISPDDTTAFLTAFRNMKLKR